MTRAYQALLHLAVVGATVAVAGCKQEVQFTRTPVAGVLEASSPASDTRVFLSIPLNLAPVLTAVEDAVTSDVARWREYVEGAACDRRKSQWLECMSALTSVTLTRDGAAEAVIEDQRLLVTLPIKYEIQAKGIGWASYLSESKVGRAVVSVPFDVSLGSGYRLDVRMTEHFLWSEKSADILARGKVFFTRTGEQRIKAQLKDAAHSIGLAIASQPVREMAERAWTTLHAPVELSKGQSLWLRVLPQRVVSAGFAREDDGIVYRIGIDSKIAVHHGERPVPFLAVALPEPAKTAGAVAAGVSETQLHLPFDVKAPGFEEAIAAAFPVTDLIETRSDAKAAPFKVRTTKVQVFPARDLLAMEFMLDVVEPKRLLGIRGQAYLTGRPVLDAATGILELRDISFPRGTGQDRDVSQQKATTAVATGLVRLGLEPFAGRIAAAARLNIGGPLESFLPALNTQIRQPVDDYLELTGRFHSVHVTSTTPIKGGFRFHLELNGLLALRSRAVRLPGGALRQTGDAAPLPRHP